jgi:hypothetical protein
LQASQGFEFDEGGGPPYEVWEDIRPLPVLHDGTVMFPSDLLERARPEHKERIDG